jgi:hypothetical protein
LDTTFSQQRVCTPASRGERSLAVPKAPLPGSRSRAAPPRTGAVQDLNSAFSHVLLSRTQRKVAPLTLAVTGPPAAAPAVIPSPPSRRGETCSAVVEQGAGQDLYRASSHEQKRIPPRTAAFKGTRAGKPWWPPEATSAATQGDPMWTAVRRQSASETCVLVYPPPAPRPGMAVHGGAHGVPPG